MNNESLFRVKHLKILRKKSSMLNTVSWGCCFSRAVFVISSLSAASRRRVLPTSQSAIVSRNPAQLMDKRSLQGKNTFNFDVRQINWEKYMDAYVLGVRTHLFKDDLCTVPNAKNHLKQ
jgi:hypothetical protein